DDDVEAGRQLADLRLLHRREIDQDQLALERVAELAEDAVALVLGVAVDEDLRGEQLAAALLDLDVDVRRAAGVRHRLDGPEVVLAAGAGQEAAEALAVGVVAAAGAVAAVEVQAPVVYLPVLAEGGLDRPALRVEAFAATRS